MAVARILLIHFLLLLPLCVFVWSLFCNAVLSVLSIKEKRADCLVSIEHLAIFLTSSNITDFNTRNKLLTQILLKQGYQYHKLPKTFPKFYRRYHNLISKFQVGLKSLLRHGLSEPEFYGDLVYKLKKIVGSNNFSAQFIKIISHNKKIGCNINVLQQTACLVVKVSKGAKIRNRYNQVPHLTQDTNGKVTNSQ